jgi:hypothetical protein
MDQWDEYGEDLVGEIRLELAQIWIDQGWQITSTGTLERLARLSIEDHARGTACRRCDGVGSHTIDRETVHCPTCRGSGRRWLSAAAKSTLAGVPRSAWRASWGQIYERHVLPVLWRYESEIGRALADQLGPEP